MFLIGCKKGNKSECFLHTDGNVYIGVIIADIEPVCYKSKARALKRLEKEQKRFPNIKLEIITSE